MCVSRQPVKKSTISERLQGHCTCAPGAGVGVQCRLGSTREGRVRMSDAQRLERLIQSIAPPDAASMALARERQDRLTKPLGALGRLEALSVWLAGVRGEARPRLRRKVVVTAAADHGVVRHGVSAYPAEVTGQMVLNFLGGGAAVNVLARQAGAEVVVVDAGVLAELP